MRDIGHGVYSTVLSATDEKDGNKEVAIKVVVSIRVSQFTFLTTKSGNGVRVL
jgi:hypothetical protein